MKMIENILGPRKLSRRYQFLDTVRILKRFAQRYPLHNNTPLTSTPFFIVGSGRSGNTLLRTILMAHGDFIIPPESYVLGNVTREYYRYNFLPWALLARLVISCFESYPQFSTWEIDLHFFYQRVLGFPPAKQSLAQIIEELYLFYGEMMQIKGKRWGDKTPMNTFNLHEINMVFPQAQYIHMLRDGRDVVASYLNTGFYDDLLEAANRWDRSVGLVQTFGDQIGSKRYHEIRYEILIAQPDDTIREVCEFLQIDFRPKMLLFWEEAQHLGDTKLLHHANVHKPISTDSIGKWRTQLSSQQQSNLESQIGLTLQKLGYSSDL